MMKIKYIVFDLDDTLLKKDKSISERTIAVLNNAKKHGFKLVINTSRSYQNSLAIIELIHPDYGIYNGGCEIVDENGNVLFSLMIPAQLTQIVTEYLNSICPEISLQTKDSFYSSDATYKGQNSLYYDFSKGCLMDAYKIICYSLDHDSIETVAKQYDLEYQNYLNSGWHRLSFKGGNKWNGILKLLSMVGGSVDDVMTFGDDFGDMEMIEKTGVGVAMQNSQKSVLDVARFITSSNEDDGVAAFIETYLLKTLK